MKTGLMIKDLSIDELILVLKYGSNKINFVDWFYYKI